MRAKKPLALTAPIFVCDEHWDHIKKREEKYNIFHYDDLTGSGMPCGVNGCGADADIIITVDLQLVPCKVYHGASIRKNTSDVIEAIAKGAKPI